MSLVFRTENCLTISQLTHNWGRELAQDGADPNERAWELEYILIKDIVNGLLDDSGPLRNGRRSGVACITEENKAGFIDGHHLLALTRSDQAMRLFRKNVVVMKEAVLDFAVRRKLPPPSWWTDACLSPGAGALGQGADLGSPSSPVVAFAKRTGRRPKKLNQVIEAMKDDIQQGRLTTEILKNLLEKNLASRYGVSRETARKAREAVLSEMSPLPTHSPPPRSSST